MISIKYNIYQIYYSVFVHIMQCRYNIGQKELNWHILKSSIQKCMNEIEPLNNWIFIYSTNIYKYSFYDLIKISSITFYILHTKLNTHIDVYKMNHICTHMWLFFDETSLTVKSVFISCVIHAYMALQKTKFCSCKYNINLG